MNKNLEDGKWVTKEVVKKTIQKEMDATWGFMCKSHKALCRSLMRAIDQLPAEPQGKDRVERKEVLEFIESLFLNTKFMGLSAPAKKPVILAGLVEISSAQPVRKAQPDEEIKEAIETLEQLFDEMKTENHPFGSYWKLRRNINLLKYVLNQPQEEKGYSGSTWTDKELLGEGEVVLSKSLGIGQTWHEMDTLNFKTLVWIDNECEPMFGRTAATRLVGYVNLVGKEYHMGINEFQAWIKQSNVKLVVDIVDGERKAQKRSISIQQRRE